MTVEQIIPRVVLGTAIFGLLYAVFLVRQVLREPQGNPKMIKIAQAIRLGANTYLKRQFKTIALLVVFLAAALYFTAPDQTIAIGRALAFRRRFFGRALFLPRRDPFAANREPGDGGRSPRFRPLSPAPDRFLPLKKHGTPRDSGGAVRWNPFRQTVAIG